PGPEIVLISGPTLGVSYPAGEEYARGDYCVRPRMIAAEGGLPRPVPGPENEPVRPAHIVAPHTEQKTTVVHVTLVQQRVLAGVLLEEADLLLFGVGAVDSEGADGIVPFTLHPAFVEAECHCLGRLATRAHILPEATPLARWEHGSLIGSALR